MRARRRARHQAAAQLRGQFVSRMSSPTRDATFLSEVLDFLFSDVRISWVLDSNDTPNSSRNVTRWVQE